MTEFQKMSRQSRVLFVVSMAAYSGYLINLILTEGFHFVLWRHRSVGWLLSMSGLSISGVFYSITNSSIDNFKTRWMKVTALTYALYFVPFFNMATFARNIDEFRNPLVFLCYFGLNFLVLWLVLKSVLERLRSEVKAATAFSGAIFGAFYAMTQLFFPSAKDVVDTINNAVAVNASMILVILGRLELLEGGNRIRIVVLATRRRTSRTKKLTKFST